MATIHDVAKKAGVSVATISRYFNQGYVGKQTRVKIEAVIKELDFKPNAVARALNYKSSKIIGLVVACITNPFFPELAKAVEEAATKEGYRLMLCSSDGCEEKEKAFIEFMALNHADGIITSTGNCGEFYSQISMPVISVDRELSTSNGHVTSDNLAGGRMALQHLYACGCRKIAFVGDQSESTSQARRRIGFTQEAEQRGISVECLYISEQEGQSVERLISELKTFEGVFAWNDSVAVEILHGFHRQGIKTPEDIKLIGFDNVHLSQIFIPAISTVGQQIDAMGAKAVEMLVEANVGTLESGAVSVLDVELIQRETTDRL